MDPAGLVERDLPVEVHLGQTRKMETFAMEELGKGVTYICPAPEGAPLGPEEDVLEVELDVVVHVRHPGED